MSDLTGVDLRCPQCGTPVPVHQGRALAALLEVLGELLLSYRTKLRSLDLGAAMADPELIHTSVRTMLNDLARWEDLIQPAVEREHAKGGENG